MAIWDGFVDGPGRTTALRAVMECLGETDTCEALIARLASAATEASLSDHALRVQYGDRTLVLKPPHVGDVTAEVPASFERLARTINGIAVEGTSWQWFGLDDDGALISGLPDVRTPIRHHDDWLAYHPEVETALGEPALCRYDGRAFDPPLTLDLGLPATILRLLALTLLGDRDVPWQR
jgi:hypothetical protein